MEIIKCLSQKIILTLKPMHFSPFRNKAQCTNCEWIENRDEKSDLQVRDETILCVIPV